MKKRTPEEKEKRKANQKRPEIREKERVQLNTWRGNHKDAHYGYNIKRKFKMTLEEYESLKIQQNNGCAICGGPPGLRSKIHFCVDHDHKTGKVRGLLCGHCNNGLGCFRDRPEVIQQAASYLEQHKIRTNPEVQSLFSKIGVK